MEILEGNKLIAEFMNYEIPKQTHDLNWITYNNMFQPMRFHSSWDWIMPAIKKYNELYGINLLYCKDSFDIQQIFKSLVSQLKLRNKCQKE